MNVSVTVIIFDLLWFSLLVHGLVQTQEVLVGKQVGVEGTC